MPAALTGPHAAGLGIKFYTGAMFPASYKDVAFIARRGSWNREKKFGYDVVIARPQANGTARIEPFMTGLLDEGKNEFHGRPTYVLQMPDGALLVSDEQNGATYRISYDAQKAAAAPAAAPRGKRK
jgi:glucose/arabinose dehydrogenase